MAVPLNAHVQIGLELGKLCRAADEDEVVFCVRCDALDQDRHHLLTEEIVSRFPSLNANEK